MKRYISLVMAAVALVMSFAIPSYAVENQWINVLDYATPNDCGSNTVVINSGDWVHFDYPYVQLGYIDFVVQFEVPASPTCAVVHQVDRNLTRVRLNDRVYRFYGKLDITNSTGIDLLFGNYPGGSIQFLSMRISATPYMSYNLPVSGFCSYDDGDTVDFFYNSSDDYHGAALYGSSDFYAQGYTAYLNFADWNKYDYIDVQLYARHLSLVSISAVLAENSIPFDISYLSADSTFETYLVNVTLDLTDVDRDTLLPLELVVTGSIPTIDGNVGYFFVLYSHGLVETSSLNESLSLWYRIKSFFTGLFGNLNAWIDNQTSSITGAIAEWGQKIVQAINPDTGAADEVIEQGSQAADQVANLTGQMNSVVKPDLNGGGDISSIISPGDMSSYTVFLSTVVNAPYIGQVVMLSLILSLAGYVLFGKR